MTKLTKKAQANRRANPTGVMEQTWLAYVATLVVAYGACVMLVRRVYITRYGSLL